MSENSPFIVINVKKWIFEDIDILYLWGFSVEKLVHVMKHHHIKFTIMRSGLNCACADSLPSHTPLFMILPLDGEWRNLPTTDKNIVHQPIYQYNTNICKILSALQLMFFSYFNVLYAQWIYFILLRRFPRWGTYGFRTGWIQNGKCESLSKTTKLILLDSLLQEVCIKTGLTCRSPLSSLRMSVSLCQSQTFFIQD